MLLLFSMLKLVLRICLVLVLAHIAPVMADDAMPDSVLTLSAHLESDRAVIRAGLIWRIYADPTDGTPARFVELSEAATPSFSLKPGAYIVHVAYGLRVLRSASCWDQTPSAGRFPLAPERWC